MDGKITALLVHNQSSPLQALRTTLQEQSIEAFTARSCGEAAGLLWDKNPPPLVFTDVQLPDGNWSDVLKLAGKARTPVNVIVVSPVVDVTFCVEAIERGAFDLIVPPFALPQVAYVVGAAAINVLRRRGEHSPPPSPARVYARNRKRKVSGEVGEAVSRGIDSEQQNYRGQDASEPACMIPRQGVFPALMNKPICLPAPSVIRARVKPLRLRPRVPKVSNSLPETSGVKAVFARTESIAEAIEASIRETQASLNAALYSFSSQRLFKALHDAQERGVHVRLLVDRGKYEDNPATRELLSKAHFDFRVARGRNGAGSKMHHKFVLLDDRMVLTGSYNWTCASEEQNYENLLIFEDRTLIDQYRQEFDALWASADEAQGLESTDPIHAPARAPSLQLPAEPDRPRP